MNVTVVDQNNVNIAITETPNQVITIDRGLLGPSGFSGYSGYSGFSGIGSSGYSGLSGFSGESGYSGTSGWSGESGTSGWSGESGYSGWSGDSGYSGYSGESGYSGFSGESGYSGTSGFSGDSGISGFSGDSGISGYSGWSGESGFSGFSGISGYSGIGLYWGGEWDYNSSYITNTLVSYDYNTYISISTVPPFGYAPNINPTYWSLYASQGQSGFSGISGYSGDSGISGYSGWSGESGYSGWSGESGFSGTSGYSGWSGTQGTSITIKGSVPNVASLPLIGNQVNDAYIVDDDGDLWVWNGTAWYDAGQIVGPVGQSGFSGYSGIADSGYSGFSGTSGQSGFSGISGFSGWSGESGWSGISGWSGSGISGFSGTSGFSGISGFSGTSGYSGASGQSGFSGISGWSGISGFSGTSGYSGYSGISGAIGQSSSLFTYYAEAVQTSGQPATGYLLWNTATQSNATQININHLTNDGSDIDIFLALLQPTQKFTIQDQNVSGNYQSWLITGATTNINPNTANSYWTVPVSLISSGGTGTTDFADNHPLFLAITAGVSGTSGYSGYSGFSGISGWSGISGASGISGWSGYSGASGISGENGASGFSGTSGFSGYSGISGQDGASGYSGISGASGFSGISGYSGYSGIDGASGFSGYSGISGYSGSGVSGYSGFSGISGYSGYSGITPTIGGSNTQVQYNNGGVLGGSANFTWNGTQLDVVGTIKSTNSTNTVGQTADVLLSLNNTNFGQTNSATLQTVLNNTTTGANDFFIKQFNHNIGSTTDVVLRANSGTSGYVSLYTNNIEGLRLTPTSLYTASTVNVGIGTSSPATKLVVYDTTAPQVTFDNGTSTFIVGNNVSGNNHILYGTGAYPMIFYTNATEGMRLDSSGNLGLGVTPSVWNTSYKTAEIGALGNGLIGFGANDFAMSSGAYYSSSGWKYSATNSLGASFYEQYTGQHIWYNKTAVSHSAGDAVTFTQAMTLDSSGSLLVGSTTVPTTGGLSRSVVSFKQLNDSGTSANIIYSSGIQLEANGNTNVLSIGYDGSSFGFNASYRTTGGYVPIAFWTGGYERLRIASGGNVGIGTSSPTAVLDVLGSFFNGGTSRTNSVTKTFGFRVPHFLTATNPMNVIGGLSTTSVNYVYIGGSDSNIGGTAATDLYFYTAANNTTANGSLRMVINSDGNLGIGTTSPDALLDVTRSGNGQIAVLQTSASRGFSFDSQSDTALQIASIQGSTNMDLWANTLSFSAGATERMRITSAGLVGIGTSSPAQLLTLNTAGADTMPALGANGGKLGIISGSLGYGLVIGVPSSGTATLQSQFVNGTASALDMSLQPLGGNVGIGTSSIVDISGGSGKTLEIYGGSQGAFTHYTNSTTGQTVSDGLVIGVAIGGSDALIIQRENANMIFRTNDTERMRIDSSGNLLVGTTSVPTTARTKGFAAKPSSSGGISIYQTDNVSDWGITATSGSIVNFYSDTGSALTYAGAISVNGVVTTYGSVSDYRLKENIVPMTGALAKVAQLKPVTYKWKLNGSDGQGFIAHELAEVVPDCVTGEKDAVDVNGKPKYQAMDTSHLVATLVSAIQEQQTIIESLTTRLTALESK